MNKRDDDPSVESSRSLYNDRLSRKLKHYPYFSREAHDCALVSLLAPMALDPSRSSSHASASVAKPSASAGHHRQTQAYNMRLMC